MLRSIKKHHSGFSIIELITVIGIMALLTTVVMVNFRQVRAQQEMQSQASEIISRIRELQTNVLAGRQISGTTTVPSAYQMIFVSGASNYEVDYITSSATTTLEIVNFSANMQLKQVNLDGTPIGQVVLRVDSPYGQITANSLPNKQVRLDLNHKIMNQVRSVIIDGISGRVGIQ